MCAPKKQHESPLCVRFRIHLLNMECGHPEGVFYFLLINCDVGSSHVLPWNSQLYIGEGAHPLLVVNNNKIIINGPRPLRGPRLAPIVVLRGFHHTLSGYIIFRGRLNKCYRGRELDQRPGLVVMRARRIGPDCYGHRHKVSCFLVHFRPKLLGLLLDREGL